MYLPYLRSEQRKGEKTKRRKGKTAAAKMMSFAFSLFRVRENKKYFLVNMLLGTMALAV